MLGIFLTRAGHCQRHNQKHNEEDGTARSLTNTPISPKKLGAMIVRELLPQHPCEHGGKIERWSAVVHMQTVSPQVEHEKGHECNNEYPLLFS
jgi:hypothetical protein